jgi:hypothetical protein
MLSDGSMPGRMRVASWVVTERRDRVYEDGGTRASNPLGERTEIVVPLVSVDFRVTPRWGVHGAVAVPLIARTGVVQRANGPAGFRDEVRGFGDSVVGAWYRGGSQRRWSWTVNGGLSMPTGSTRQPRFRSDLEDGSLVPLSRLQRGSGSWDPVFGLATEHPAAGGRCIMSLAARSPFAESREGLRTGAAWELGSGYAHTVRTHKVMAYGRADWLHRQQDVFRGTPVLVGGGHWFYVTPGVAVMVGKGFNIQSDVKLPVYRRLANRQLDSSAIFQLGVSRSF